MAVIPQASRLTGALTCIHGGPKLYPRPFTLISLPPNTNTWLTK